MLLLETSLNVDGLEVVVQLLLDFRVSLGISSCQYVVAHSNPLVKEPQYRRDIGLGREAGMLSETPLGDQVRLPILT